LLNIAGLPSYASIAARRGKEVDVPAQSEMLVRIDNTVTVPGAAAANVAPSVAR